MLTKQDLKEFSKIIKPLHKDLKTIKEDVRDIRDKQNSIVSFFEREYLSLRTRIELIEEHLGL